MKTNNQSAEFFLMPGLPHLLSPKLNPSYAKLAEACTNIGRRITESGCERVIYYSTGWLSVLGTSFQARKKLSGLHVDENWYELGDLPFDFNVDDAFAEGAAAEAQSAGFATASVDYEGFPVDTGTIVAERLVNPKKLPVCMVSSHVYQDYAGTQKLGSAIAQAMVSSAKKTAVVGVTSLSTRYFTEAIDYANDQIRNPEDDRWNRRMLELIETGDFRSVSQTAGEYAQQTKADMGFKAFAFLDGAMSMGEGSWRGKVTAYGPIYGTGAAVIEFKRG